MSVKHIKEYYKQVTDDYLSMKQDLADIEEAAKIHQVSPEQVENMRQLIAPVKLNYETISYYMYLLNMPNKKEKQSGYQKRMKSLVDCADSRTREGVLKENSAALRSLREIREELQNE